MGGASQEQSCNTCKHACAEHGAGGSEQSVAEEASASDLHCWSTKAAATAAG